MIGFRTLQDGSWCQVAAVEVWLQRFVPLEGGIGFGEFPQRLGNDAIIWDISRTIVRVWCLSNRFDLFRVRLDSTGRHNTVYDQNIDLWLSKGALWKLEGQSIDL